MGEHVTTAVCAVVSSRRACARQVDVAKSRQLFRMARLRLEVAEKVPRRHDGGGGHCERAMLERVRL